MTVEKSRRVLDLDTLAPARPTVRIRTKKDRKGKLYELADIEDLSLAKQVSITSLGKEVDIMQPKAEAMEESDEYDEEVVEDFESAIDRFLLLVMIDLPSEVLAQLNVMQKLDIMKAFTQASPKKKAGGARKKKKSKTPAKPLRGSNNSTAARRKAGSISGQRS